MKRAMVAHAAFVDACLALQDLNRAGHLWDYAIEHDRLDLIPRVEHKSLREGWRAWKAFMEKLAPGEREKVNRFLSQPITHVEGDWEFVPVYGLFSLGFRDGVLLRKEKLHFFFFPESWLFLLEQASLFSVTCNIPTKTNWFIPLYLRTWAVACGIALHILALIKKEERYNQGGATLVRWGLYDEWPSPQALGHALKLCFQNQDHIPSPEDIQSQMKLLEEFKGAIPGLEEFFTTVQRVFSLVPRPLTESGLPIIFVDDNTQDEEVLAQMCLWGYRQTKEEAYVAHLLDYTRRVLGKENPTDVVSHVLAHWHSPVSRYSFSNYLKRVSFGLREKPPGEEITVEIPQKKGCKKKAKPPLPSFPMPLIEASFRLLERVPYLQLSREAVYRRLLRAVKKGILPSIEEDEHRIAKDGTVALRKSFFLSEEGFNKAVEFLQETEGKKAIVREYVRLRGVTRRSAERWLKRRLDQGKTLEEIYGTIAQKALSVTPRRCS